MNDIPALAITISTRPYNRLASVNNRSTSLDIVASPCTAVADPPVDVIAVTTAAAALASF
jgi:hypothetical protein